MIQRGVNMDSSQRKTEGTGRKEPVPESSQETKKEIKMQKFWNPPRWLRKKEDHRTSEAGDGKNACVAERTCRLQATGRSCTDSGAAQKEREKIHGPGMPGRERGAGEKR